MQCKVILIPDYSETESVFIYKVHHSLGDGIATILMLFNLTDNPDYKDFPPIMMRFSILQEIFITLGTPLLVAYYGAQVLLRKFQLTPFTEDKVVNNLQKKKRIYFTSDIGVQDVKNASQRMSKEIGKKITFNDIVLTVLSKTMKQKCTERGYPDLKSIELCVPFSLRPPPIGV